MFNALRLTAALLSLVVVSAVQKNPDISEPKDNACSGAASQLEMNQCTAGQYHKADERLNKVYADIQADIKKDMQLRTGQGDEKYKAWNQQRLEKLQLAERAWLHYRDLHCEASRYEYEGGSINPAIWADCMRLTTEHRIQELKTAYPVDGEPRK